MQYVYLTFAIENIVCKDCKAIYKIHVIININYYHVLYKSCLSIFLLFHEVFILLYCCAIGTHFTYGSDGDNDLLMYLKILISK